MESRQSKLRQKFRKPFFSFASDYRLRRQNAHPTPPPTTVVNGTETPMGDEESTAEDTWRMNTPRSQPSTSTIHEGYAFAASNNYSSAPSVDPSSAVWPHLEHMSRPTSVHQEGLHAGNNFDTNFLPQKSYEDQFTFHGLPSDRHAPIGQAMTTDEAIPIIDLDSQTAYSPNFDTKSVSHRMSGSSFTMSTPGAYSDVPTYEDYSATISDAHSFCSDYPPPSNRTSWMSSTPLSPVASPRIAPQTRSELVRSQSRGRASPSPRPTQRSAPYSLDANRSKRWSTGSCALSRRASPFVSTNVGIEALMSQQQHMYLPGPPMHTAPEVPFEVHSQPSFMQTRQPSTNHRNSMLLPTQMPSQLPSQPLLAENQAFDSPAPLLSQNFFKMLQSNTDAHPFHHRYANLSDPPDLFSALSEDQAPPPPEDMHPEDPEMTPREQDLRFEGDLYTPRWVRGHGNKREGWCGICKPGRWLVLKNSAYWYDKSFSHGVSAATGASFQEPLETRRMEGNPDVWEGLCNGCHDWIALVSSKKKGTTWFRHAYKCHAHPKAKDSVKRRRESSLSKTQSTPSKFTKMENQGPSSPHIITAPGSVYNTPTAANKHMTTAYMTPMPPEYTQAHTTYQPPPNYTLMSMGRANPEML